MRLVPNQSSNKITKLLIDHVWSTITENTNVEPDPAKIEFDMPVDVVFDDALGRKDRDGNAYLSYFFQPKAG